MKKLIISIIGVLFLTTGCFDKTDFKDDYTYTTVYPIEYITNLLYSDYSNIGSIYPNGVNVYEYTLTNKLKQNYSKGNTFIYNGTNKEKEYAVDFLNLNKNIKIIDAMQGMNFTYSQEELWLDPSNFLMIASNIKNGLKEYNDNVYINDKIDELYEELKINASLIDVNLKLIGDEATYHSILASNDLFNYLNKYNIEVISLDYQSKNIDKAYTDAKKAISDKKIKYFYKIKGEVLREEVTKFIENNKLEILEIHTLNTLTDQERKANEDYNTIMNKNIEEYKKELYK